MNGDYYKGEEVGLLGCGQNVLIHRFCVIPNPKTVKIGSNVRIDAFSVLSAKHIDIGSYIHIAAHVTIVGQSAVIMGNFSAMSHGSRIFSSTDDLNAGALTNPMVEEFGAVYSERVHIESHAIIGTGAVVMPGVRIGKGSIVGALSYAKTDVPEFTIVGGVPAKHIKPRSRSLESLEKALLERLG